MPYADVVVICNDQGQLHGLPQSVFGYRGTILFCRRTKAGELIDLDAATVDACMAAVHEWQRDRYSN